MQSYDSPTLADRFWTRVVRTDGCWGWTGAKFRGGYGKINSGPRGHGNLFAHRVSWVLHHGPIPDQVYVLHRCDNPPCTNPAHLYLGDHADNMGDKASRGRGRTISESTVRQILSANGTISEIAEQAGVARSTAWRIRNGKEWVAAR